MSCLSVPAFLTTSVFFEFFLRLDNRVSDTQTKETRTLDCCGSWCCAGKLRRHANTRLVNISSDGPLRLRFPSRFSAALKGTVRQVLVSRLIGDVVF